LGGLKKAFTRKPETYMRFLRRRVWRYRRVALTVLAPAPYLRFFERNAKRCLRAASPPVMFAADQARRVKRKSMQYGAIVLDTLQNLPIEVCDGEIVVFRHKNFSRRGLKALPPESQTPAELGAGAEIEPEAADSAPGAEPEPADGHKMIYVLLTMQGNLTSRLLRVFTGHPYTHSSIALEREGSFYSFNPGRGFTVERPVARKRGSTPCKLFAIKVSAEAHAQIAARIRWLIENPDEYKFNYVGLVFLILHIPVGIENRYFCSQFVSEMLDATGEVDIRKRPTSYFPRYFGKQDEVTLDFKGEAGEFPG